MTKLQGSWVWYELMTPDAEASKAFYDKVVGWNIQTTHGDTDGYGFIVNADGGMTGGILHLTDEMREGGAFPLWIGYIGVYDVNEALKAIKAAGGKIQMGATDIEMAGRIAMVTDPNGAPFYIMTPKPPPGASGENTCFSPTLEGRCSWNELMSADQASALTFYTSLFGWGLPEPMDMGAMGTYQFVTHDDVMTGAIMQNTPENPMPIWNHYFRVPSIEAAKSMVEANGGTVFADPMQVPGGDWVINGKDPQGAMFSLVGGK